MTAVSKLKGLLSNFGLLEPAKKCIYGVNNARHLMREVLYRAPNPLMKIQQYLFPPSREIKNAVNELRREGIVILTNYVQSERLAELKNAFNNFVKNVERIPTRPIKMTPYGGHLHAQIPYPEQGHDDAANITFSNDPFKHCKGFLELALDEFILRVIAGYMGKHFMLQQAIASRYYPNEKTDFGSCSGIMTHGVTK